ncbi:hypothetical protein A7L07_18910 [Acinetobacter baumannii]|uniref:hypothetical protein n=1 Tax=Acinetobacter baumannii TaxID=470 RepID=UPI0008DC918E|nr:hypothetical protein [Acinetobacter baumannii]OIC80674.1 hypothetical protein A7L07_18910 [Acinetobacter baumannii]
MAQSAIPSEGQLTCQWEFKSTADDVYGIFRRECFKFPEIMPLEIAKVELLKGTWASLNSERRWTFKDAQNCGVWEDIVTAILDQRKSITFNLTKGEVPHRFYNSLNVVFQFSPNDKGGCKGEAVLTFMKNNANAPDPKGYIDFINHKMFPDVDKYLQGPVGNA